MKGEFIVEYIGEYLSKAECEERLKESHIHWYLFMIDENLFIDSRYKGNIARMINHSCNPNSRATIYNSQGRKVIGLFANKNINKDCEITINYQYLIFKELLGDNFNLPKCRCKESKCIQYWSLKSLPKSEIAKVNVFYA